jgi:thiol-disulfide isomerase/thioredoxin
MKKKITQIALVLLLLSGAIAGIYYKVHYEPIQEIVSKTDSPYDHAEIVQPTVKLTGKSQNTPNKDTQQLTSKEIGNKPVVYLLFKPGCENCQKLFPTEEKVLAQLPETLKARVYYVNTLSPLGRELKKKYGIKTSAAAILETNDPTDSKIYSLKHGDGNAEESLQEIFNLLRDRATEQ